MRKGASIAIVIVFLALCATAVAAFSVNIQPGTIVTEVQAGGYVSELIEVQADAPIQIVASASSSIIPLIKLTRYNDTALYIHVLPPADSSEGTFTGTLNIGVQGQSPFLSAGLQQIEVPLNVTIIVKGKASQPASVVMDGETIDVIPLSSDTATLLVIVIVGIVALNIVLRTRLARRKQWRQTR